jgi:hypothetical protein
MERTPSVASFGHSAPLDPVAIDPLHFTVALDNAWVRALRVRYAPGEGSPMHDHPAGVRVFLTAIHNRFMKPDGSTSEVSRRAGEVIWAEAVRHGNVNLGGSDVEIVELEIKGLPPRPAVVVPRTAAPDVSETVLIENEFVRVLWAAVGGLKQTTMHAHPNTVVVTMTEEHSRSSDASGSAEEHRRARGHVSWAPAGARITENLRHEPLEAVIVEFKGGPTW